MMSLLKHGVTLCCFSRMARSRQSCLVSACLIAAFLAATVLAQGKAFDPVPVARLPFNWPDQPKEGAADFFTIAVDGQPRCVIVLPAKGSRAAGFAASGLATYLRLVTGARIRLIKDTAPVPEGMSAIHVGTTAVALKVDLGLPDVRYGNEVLPNLNGYLVKTVDARTLVIRGMTDSATRHGVVGFLKRCVGVRQYWLGPAGGIGDVIPAKPTLRVPEIEWRDWPYVYSRSMSMKPFGPGPRTVDFFRRQRTLPCNENYGAWLPPATYAKTHPEYFSLVSGKRRVPGPKQRASGWQPCVSNPDVPRIMGEAVLAYFRKHPDAVGVNFAINDGGGNCTCDGCRAMDAPNTDYSRQVGMGDRYVKLTNKVCEIVRREFPDKILVYLAYAGARSAPATVNPDPMIMPVLTVPGNAFAAWDAWARTGARRMGLYVHHDDTLFFILPKVDVRQSAKRIRYAVSSGRARLFYMEAFPHWPISGVVPYVTSELLWDPRQDVDAVLDEYYRTFFGPAAAHMKAFHDALEAGYERWLQEQGAPHPFGKDISAINAGRSPRQFRVLTPEEASRASAALARAVKAAGGKGRAPERVQVARLMFGLQQLAVRSYWTAERLRDMQIRSETDARQAVASSRRLVALSREMRDYIVNVLEQPPVDAYRLFRRPKTQRQNPFYERFRSGKPGPEVAAAITAAMNRAADFLRESLGAEKAAAWWRDARSAEKDVLLQAAFRSAEVRAKGIEIRNMIADPSFEDAAGKFAPDEFAVDEDIVLDKKQQASVGLRHWFPERAPYRNVLTKKEAHSGRYSLMLEHCHRARLSRYVRAAPGARYRVGLWIKRNEAGGAYAVAVDAKTRKGGYPNLASVQVPKKPGEWQEIVTDVTAPPDATLIIIRLFARGQARDGRCWVDDLSIGKYPE